MFLKIILLGLIFLLDMTGGIGSLYETQDVLRNNSSTVTDVSDKETTSFEPTTSVPRDATTFCSENKEVGTFKAEGDITCKRYYVCTTYMDGFKGYEFNCGVTNFFNSETSLCQKEKPDDCLFYRF